MGRSAGRGRQRGEGRREDEGKNEKERDRKRMIGLSPSIKFLRAPTLQFITVHRNG